MIKLNKQKKSITIFLLTIAAFFILIILIFASQDNTIQDKKLNNTDLNSQEINKSTMKLIDVNIDDSNNTENNEEDTLNENTGSDFNTQEDESEFIENDDTDLTDNHNQNINNDEDLVNYGELTANIHISTTTATLSYIEILQIPEETEEITAIFYPINSEDPLNDENLFVQSINSDFMDGIYFNVNNYQSGAYTLTLGATNAQMPEENPWIDKTTLNFTIEN